MGNLEVPVITARHLGQYAREIHEAGKGYFRPYMTLFLTSDLYPDEVLRSNTLHDFVGVKYMPRGASTKSNLSIENSALLWTRGTRPHDILQFLARLQRVLLVHGAEALDSNGEVLDPWKQEIYFFREVLPRIRDAHPTLKISVEHLSTAIGAEYMRQNGGPLLGCGITAHHLLLDRRDMFQGGFWPHRFWWPVLGEKEDREAIRAFVKEGHKFVYLGSDSAPHPIGAKQSGCCSGGVLMAHAGIELYVEAFEDMGALDEPFEAFASINGPRFYGIEPSSEMITLVKKEWQVRPLLIAGDYGFNPAEVVPFRLGEKYPGNLSSKSTPHPPPIQVGGGFFF
jgi:dihydroorotase